MLEREPVGSAGALYGEPPSDAGELANERARRVPESLKRELRAPSAPRLLMMIGVPSGTGDGDRAGVEGAVGGGVSTSVCLRGGVGCSDDAVDCVGMLTGGCREVSSRVDLGDIDCVSLGETPKSSYPTPNLASPGMIRRGAAGSTSDSLPKDGE